AAKRRHRLHGVPDAAVTLIESFQPYDTRDKSLRILADLHDTDKHRTLNLVTAVASDAAVLWHSDDGPLMNMFYGGGELRDGAVFGNIGLPFSKKLLAVLGSNESLAAFKRRFFNMKVEGDATLFVAFGKSGADELEPFRVDVTLQ